MSIGYEKKRLFIVKSLETPMKLKNLKEFKYREEKMSLLGISNKHDLLKTQAFEQVSYKDEFNESFDNDRIAQYIYTGEQGELFEVLIMADSDGEYSVIAIRTRRKAD